MTKWDKSVDFLVMGSGAAAMGAAVRGHDLGLEVLMVEKTDLFGGNTAMSGGVVWIPNNPAMKKTSIPDSDEEALIYLKHITHGEIEEERLQNYVDESKRVLAYLHEHTHVRYTALERYTDYYPEAPGGKEGGRSMDPTPLDGAKLRESLMAIRPMHPQAKVLGKFGITAREAHAALGLGFVSMMFMAWQLLRYWLRSFKRKKWGRDTRLVGGNALVGRLFLSLKERGVEAWANAPVQSLVLDGGRVVGAVVEKDGQPLRIQATQGVLLAAGGFSKNAEMRHKYQREPITTEWTAGGPGNTGDAILMGMDAGAEVSLMDDAWWTPTSRVPRYDPAWVLVVEKSLPHGVFVNLNGQRFTNEAAPYVDVVLGMYDDASKNAGADSRWFHVFDAEYRRMSIAGPLAPSKMMPDSSVPRRFRDGGYIYRAETLDELAETLGLPAPALQETLDRFNVHAVKGEDPDFNRGWSAQDRYYGHPSVKPNCSLGPVSKPPFYAIEIFPGDLGTKGGVVTDTQSRVLRPGGSGVIEGLYAAGNSSASIMGRTYPGAGGTIGPALTGGFAAAESAAAAKAEPEAEAAQ
jgi:3-oxosteroid 1-dehydrogenase